MCVVKDERSENAVALIRFKQLLFLRRSLLLLPLYDSFPCLSEICDPFWAPLGPMLDESSCPPKKGPKHTHVHKNICSDVQF